MLLLEHQQAVHQAGAAMGLRRRPMLVEHRREVPGPPCRRLVGIDIEARRRRRPQPARVVHRRLARAARQSFPTGCLELARRVVAGVAHHAATVEDGLDGLRIRLPRGRHDRLVEAPRVGRAEQVVEGPDSDRGAGGDQNDDGDRGHDTAHADNPRMAAVGALYPAVMRTRTAPARSAARAEAAAAGRSARRGRRRQRERDRLVERPGPALVPGEVEGRVVLQHRARRGNVGHPPPAHRAPPVSPFLRAAVPSRPRVGRRRAGCRARRRPPPARPANRRCAPCGPAGAGSSGSPRSRREPIRGHSSAEPRRRAGAARSRCRPGRPVAAASRATPRTTCAQTRDPAGPARPCPGSPASVRWRCGCPARARWRGSPRAAPGPPRDLPGRAPACPGC